jgi:5-methylcytosine-specific restriction endonuclease McrA
MSETSTIFICKRCEAPFEHVYRTGRKPERCEACRLELKRAAARARVAKVYVKRVPGVPETFECLDCDQAFEFTRGQGRQSTRCRSCQKARNTAMTVAGRRARGRTDLKFAPGERIYPCVSCEAQIVCKPTGRKPIYCPECRKGRSARQAQAQKKDRQARPPRRITCIDCSIVVILALRGASQQKRCADCAKKKARAIQKRMSSERRAWKYGAESDRYEDQDVFERDNWRCGLCRKKIDKRLKHPHMMAATVDHIIPYTKGGDNVLTNVHAAHRQCNQDKYNLGGGEQMILIGLTPASLRSA